MACSAIILSMESLFVLVRKITWLLPNSIITRVFKRVIQCILEVREDCSVSNRKILNMTVNRSIMCILPILNCWIMRIKLWVSMAYNRRIYTCHMIRTSLRFISQRRSWFPLTRYNSLVIWRILKTAGLKSPMPDRYPILIFPPENIIFMSRLPTMKGNGPIRHPAWRLLSHPLGGKPLGHCRFGAC